MCINKNTEKKIITHHPSDLRSKVGGGIVFYEAQSPMWFWVPKLAQKQDSLVQNGMYGRINYG